MRPTGRAERSRAFKLGQARRLPLFRPSVQQN